MEFKELAIYLKNENVEDLGAEYEQPVLTPFAKLGVGHYFVFHQCRTMCQNVSRYHFRPVGSTEQLYYNRNGDTQDLGKDFGELIEPIHIRVKKRS